jgi:hypothetical protein
MSYMPKRVKGYEARGELYILPKDMTSSILADKISEVGPQSHVSNSRFLITPAINWETLKEYETLSIKNFGTNRLQKCRQLRKGKVVLQ